MDVEHALPLLGGLSPAGFMRRHWHKRPLLVRQAWPGVVPPLSRAGLFALAGSDEVESRLVWREGRHWQLRQGPIARRALPPLSRPGWTLLVQGLDLHVPAAHAMLRPFRFIPDARLDDLMVSWASPGGGVGPHLDSYDVFLLQVQGQRRWRVGRVPQPRWRRGVPLKQLVGFQPTMEWVLEPGDMLYLPPLWGHEGDAVGGDCMTCSIGFRAPARDELADALLQRLSDGMGDSMGDDPGPRYRDPAQPATGDAAEVPQALIDFATAAVQRRLDEPAWIERALGEWLTEPKAQVRFEASGGARAAGGVRLSPRTRMLHHGRHVFINGEAFVGAGRDLTLLRHLAAQRHLPAADVRRLSDGARALMREWLAAGWLEPAA